MRHAVVRALVFTSAALVASTLSPERALAGGYQLAEQGVTNVGLGGAGAARTNDANAAYYNPAALADGGGLRVSLGAFIAQSRIDAESTPEAPDGPWSASTEQGASTIPHVHASYAWDRWAVGMSAYVPFASNVQWPIDWAQRFAAVRSELQVLRLAPFAGVRVGPVRLAVGPTFDTVSLESERATDHVSQEGVVHLRMDGRRTGAHAALFIEAHERLSLGVTYRSRAKYSLDGEADFSVPPEFAMRYPDQKASTVLWAPDQLVFGLAGTITKQIRAYADVSYTWWSLNDELYVDFTAEDTPDSIRRNDWSDTWALRMGGEFDVHRMVQVRAGFFVDGMPGPAAPAQNLTPTGPDMRRTGVGLGASLSPWTWLSVHVAYQYIHLTERESTSADAPLAKYSGEAHFVGFGVSTQGFGATEPSSDAP